MHKRLRSMFFLIVFNLSFAVFAETLTDSNQINVPVMDRSQTVLTQALQQGLTQTLIKMSGNPSIATLSVIRNILPNAAQWVQSYGYVESLDAQGRTQLLLQIQFDQAGLKKLLKKSGQAMWHSDRPLTLIILKNNNQLQPIIQQLARVRALPILFPMMDLSDQANLNGSVQNTSLQDMQLFAKRYGVFSILEADSVEQKNNEWYIHWSYFLNGQIIQWETSGITQEIAVKNILNKVAHVLFNQSATNNNNASQTQVTLGIVGVTDVSQFAKIMNYLRGRNEVVQVSVKDINPSRLLLSVNINGDVDHFRQILNEDGQLKPVSSVINDPSEQADMYYYW